MLKLIQSVKGIATLAIISSLIIYNFLPEGLFSSNFEFSWGWLVLHVVLLSHVTISAMSLSFHRYHTHKGVILNKTVDFSMQLFLWLITGMNKQDWVSVHMYHHATSDTDKDPHSPVHKGFWHVLFLGGIDYARAKRNPEIQAIAARLPMTASERFFTKYTALGLILMSMINLILFGIEWGWIISALNFSMSPVFAVGGVNTLAHWFGYRNHKSGDNSRNIGFLFPLNFMTCGELDHNNHHGHQKSCSFRHKWYEFDIGYVYIKLLSYVGLAQIKNVYSPTKMKEDFARRVARMLEKNTEVQDRIDALSDEIGIAAQEIKEQIKAYVEGNNVKLEKQVKAFKKELIKMVRESYITEPSFA